MILAVEGDPVAQNASADDSIPTGLFRSPTSSAIRRYIGGSLITPS